LAWYPEPSGKKKPHDPSAVLLISTFLAFSGQPDNLVATLTGNMRSAHGKKGVIDQILLKDLQSEDTLYLLETYRNPEALAQGETAGRGIEMPKDLIRSKTSEIFRPVAGFEWK
jgi:quinol monooxygenase YgiN